MKSKKKNLRYNKRKRRGKKKKVFTAPKVRAIEISLPVCLIDSLPKEILIRGYQGIQAM